MAARLTLVALLSIISVACWVPDLPRAFGHPMATAGFKVGSSDAIMEVDRNSPAQRAGVRVGQRVDWRATPLESRILLLNSSYQNLHFPQRFPVRLLDGKREFTALVQSNLETRADAATVLPRAVIAVVLLLAGIALLLLRPSKATWGFFIFSAWNVAAPVNAIMWFGPPAYQIAMTVLSTVGWSIISQVGAFIFALYLLVPHPVARWRIISEYSAYAVSITTTAFTAFAMASWAYNGTPFDAVNRLNLALGLVAAFSPPVLLGITYASSDAATRERIRWVIFAFVVNAFTCVVIFVTGQGITNITIPYWLWGTLAGADSFIIAATVLYAVLKHHIIDINVVISRAVVYTILSAVIVGTFALIDLFFTRTVFARAGLIVEVALALVLGFFFNSLHNRVDRFVDRVLFRERHAAEEHLQTVIRGMPFSVSEAQVDRLVIEEPVRSFFLSGAALFAASEDGRFTLRHSVGAAYFGLSVKSREDSLPAYLEGERAALRLNKHGWNVPGIAIPIFSHGDLTAIAIYGLHQNGTDLDGDEIALFESVAAAAGNAFDRLEAQRLRDEVRELRLERVGVKP